MGAEQAFWQWTEDATLHALEMQRVRHTNLKTITALLLTTAVAGFCTAAQASQRDYPMFFTSMFLGVAAVIPSGLLFWSELDTPDVDDIMNQITLSYEESVKAGRSVQRSARELNDQAIAYSSLVAGVASLAFAVSFTLSVASIWR